MVYAYLSFCLFLGISQFWQVFPNSSNSIGLYYDDFYHYYALLLFVGCIFLRFKRLAGQLFFLA